MASRPPSRQPSPTKQERTVTVKSPPPSQRQPRSSESPIRPPPQNLKQEPLSSQPPQQTQLPQPSQPPTIIDLVDPPVKLPQQIPEAEAGDFDGFSDMEVEPPESQRPPNTQPPESQPRQPPPPPPPASAPARNNHRAQLKTPEPRASKQQRMGGPAHRALGAERSPSTPGYLVPFDWEDFEARYHQALEDANQDEQQILDEFEQLVKYFNVWASAASTHDNERGIKRLQTRERYVRIAEQRLQQKKLHLGEVVRAFQSALALLSQS